ncbi:hypothetical protein BHK98_02630 [Hornefia porci]|uniref:DUF7698 domain-containing protein n=1 Tax=Hornefia porci TaxID=2652292 RepID=A0A1Q9JFT1_9FIRM|nr:hypothetical protein [Hornefia porci]OLR55058.1 hypothetical protein BHK98_02630 [Hornefia porci]
MLKKENAHFDNLMEIARVYDEAKKAHEAKKQEIIDTYSWDSEELKGWYAEKAYMTFPISQGACKAYRAFCESIEHENEELQMDDFLWESEVEDFVSCLKEAGIGTFVYTNQSTAVMENLHGFAAAGCKMDGLCTIKRWERRFGENREKEILGIHFTVC